MFDLSFIFMLLSQFEESEEPWFFVDQRAVFEFRLEERGGVLVAVAAKYEVLVDYGVFSCWLQQKKLNTELLRLQASWECLQLQTRRAFI